MVLFRKWSRIGITIGICAKNRGQGEGGAERESKRMEKVNILGITSKPRCVSDLVNGNNG